MPTLSLAHSLSLSSFAIMSFSLIFFLLTISKNQSSPLPFTPFASFSHKLKSSIFLIFLSFFSLSLSLSSLYISHFLLFLLSLSLFSLYLSLYSLSLFSLSLSFSLFLSLSLSFSFSLSFSLSVFISPSLSLSGS